MSTQAFAFGYFLLFMSGIIIKQVSEVKGCETV